MSTPAKHTAHRPPLLQATGLSCHYGGQLALDRFELTLHGGEVLGLVGLNGAGKSTALRLLCGLLAPSAGEVRVAGYALGDQPLQARRQLGYLPDPPALHDCLSPREAIDTNARLHGLVRAERRRAAERVIAQCQLGEVADKRIRALSKGYRQRVGLALALVHDPAVLVLDEPASGLDPAQSQHLNQLIAELGRERAVIFSSHAIADVRSCCTRVALLQNGRLVHDNPVQPREARARQVRLQLRQPVDADALLALPGVRAARRDGADWLLELAGDGEDALLAAIVQHGWGLRALHPSRDSMDAVLKELQRPTADLDATQC